MKNIIMVISATVVITSAVVVVVKHKQNANSISLDSDYISCMEICHKKLLANCDRVKGDLDNCEVNCERWTPSMKACVKKANQCADLDLDFTRDKEELFREDRDPLLAEKNKMTKKSYCTIIDDDYDDIREKEQVNEIQYGCSGACYKYKQCAGFGKGVGEKDKNDAYNSCFSECQHWSQKTLACMEKVKIESPADCAPLTMCGLSEYKNFGTVQQK